MWSYRLRQELKLAAAHLDRIMGAPMLRRRFRRRHGYALDLDNPQTFSEKIQWRKLKDNNPLFPILSNKYLLRNYVVDRLGQERAQDLLVPLLQYVEDPKDLDFAALPASYVVKATHGSGMNMIVEDGAAIDQSAARTMMQLWRATHYHISAHEWVYTKTPKGIMVEQMVAPPAELRDVKLQFFNGILRGFFIKEIVDRQVLQTFFGADRTILDYRRGNRPNNPDTILPVELDEIIATGKALAGDLDFVRVDFLYGANKYYIGEMTLFSGSGMVKLEPPTFDQVLGSYWTLPEPGKHNT